MRNATYTRRTEALNELIHLTPGITIYGNDNVKENMRNFGWS